MVNFDKINTILMAKSFDMGVKIDAINKIENQEEFNQYIDNGNGFYYLMHNKDLTVDDLKKIKFDINKNIIKEFRTLDNLLNLKCMSVEMYDYLKEKFDLKSMKSLVFSLNENNDNVKSSIMPSEYSNILSEVYSYNSNLMNNEELMSRVFSDSMSVNFNNMLKPLMYDTKKKSNIDNGEFWYDYIHSAIDFVFENMKGDVSQLQNYMPEIISLHIQNKNTEMIELVAKHFNLRDENHKEFYDNLIIKTFEKELKTQMKTNNDFGFVERTKDLLKIIKSSDTTINKIHDLSINNLVVSDKNTLNYTENKNKVDDVTQIKHKKNSR